MAMPQHQEEKALEAANECDCDHGRVLVFSCVDVCECGLCPDIGDCPECRIVLCEHCGSEGRIYRGQYDDERDCGECPACAGTGGEIVKVEPITEEDIETQAAEERGESV